MAKSAGRAFELRYGGTAIAAVRNKGVTWNGTPIDITNDDDDGDTSYLADRFASTTLEITVDGLTDSDVLSDLAFSTSHADKHDATFSLVRANGDAISGNFIITSYSETGAYQDATTFSATIIRNGTHTWTPAA